MEGCEAGWSMCTRAGRTGGNTHHSAAHHKLQAIEKVSDISVDTSARAHDSFETSGSLDE